MERISEIKKSIEIEFRAWIQTETQKHMAIQGEPDLETLWSFMYHYGDEKNLMQFTGLLDKNGVKIYEHDILELPNGTQGLVKQLECGFILLLKDSVVWNNLLFNVVHHYTVIGNVHENPELL